ncbi:class I SAM-dependent methyltransferase [Acidisoma sp.]|uniref:class I SAM-dependent methyltransferase n=1 Tax=Acidisoma sp. TaxID=1872115 RepID=UPI003AFFF61D
MSTVAATRRALSPEMVEAARAFGAESGISGALSADDYIFWYIHDNMAAGQQLGAATEYLQSGKGTAYFLGALLAEPRLVEVLAQRANPASPVSLLDFASGYGRVTRHIPKEVPNTEVFACDIHAEAVAFIQSMGFQAFQSAHLPEKLDLGRKFDVVFVLSFFTHMPRRTWKPWLDALARQLNPNGLLIFTAHGEVSQILMGVQDLEPDGFFFHSVSEQKDLDTSEYGNTVTTFEYVYSQIRDSGLKLLQFKQAGAGHHDLYVLHNHPSGSRYLDALEAGTGNLSEIAAKAEAAREQAEAAVARLQRQLDDVYRSTSWRITGPMRTLGGLLKR